jgi:hypothetical protein
MIVTVDVPARILRIADYLVKAHAPDGGVVETWLFRVNAVH